MKLKCPKCGNNDSKKFSKEHENDFREDLIICKECGHSANKKAFVVASSNPFVKISDGNFSDNKDEMPSNKGDFEKHPYGTPRNKKKKYRKKPEGRLDEDLNPTENENVRRVSMNNPFIKKINKKSVKRVAMKKDFNPFTKEAREFKLLPRQEEKEELNDSQETLPPDNMDEGPLYNRQVNYHGDFTPLDRLERRNNEDPKDFIPGYKEWHDREVDEYYDGWVEDHIENSGGKIVGSNTEQKMNLDEGERNHPPKYPTEAPYESLLENRHIHDDDLVKAIAKNKKQKRISKKKR